MTDKENFAKDINVPSKEQIIIDGVDVSKCENFRPKDRFSCYPHICNCHQKPNCYFKQLARKIQECEQKDKELDLYKTWYRAKHGDIKNYLGHYRKECEKLKRKVELMMDCPDCKVDEYEEALEEIEEIIKSSTKDFNHIDWEAKAYHALIAIDKISDTIDKVKEEV